MKAKVYNQKAEEVKSIELNDLVFNKDVNDKVLAQYTYIYLSNQRQGNANTKDKSEVRGGGKKPWRQKGTGRARAGSSRSPLWRGGGVTFGPTSNVNWKKLTTKAFRKNAMRNALSKVAKENLLKIVDEFKLDADKALTKQAVNIIKSFGEPKKVTIVSAEKNEALINSFANLKKAKVVLINELNAYEVINAGTLLIEEKALEYINNHWGN